MRYHGFDIEPVYLPGSDFRITAEGKIVDRQPTKLDISHYTLTQYDGSWSHANCDSISHAKQLIDFLHQKLADAGLKLV